MDNDPSASFVGNFFLNPSLPTQKKKRNHFYRNLRYAASNPPSLIPTLLLMATSQPQKKTALRGWRAVPRQKRRHGVSFAQDVHHSRIQPLPQERVVTVHSAKGCSSQHLCTVHRLRERSNISRRSRRQRNGHSLARRNDSPTVKRKRMRDPRGKRRSKNGLRVVLVLARTLRVGRTTSFIEHITGLISHSTDYQTT